MKSLVFICLGNICRSPMAERVARGMAADRGLDVEVTSCAMSSHTHGSAMDHRARAVLEPAGYDAAGHRARPVTEEIIRSSTLVVAAEPHQVTQLRRVSPGSDNIALLNDFNPELPKGTVLDDPWYGDAAGFHDTLADIEAAMPGILDEIESRSR